MPKGPKMAEPSSEWGKQVVDKVERLVDKVERLEYEF